MERIETLRMEGVARQFGNAAALRDFTLDIKGGTFTTLLGPSGCGKTTALNCLAGLLDLSAGKIFLNGQPIHHIPAEKRGFGLVFQNYALFPHLNAARNVAYGLEIKRVPKVERQQRVQEALAMVHLEEFGNRYPAQMSGGQQQRLAIARTIVLRPSLLLMDEPLSNLDANLRNEMRLEIKRIHTELNLTTVYVTHDQAEAMSLSDTVVVMRQGLIEQVGTPQEIYNQPHSLYVAKFMGYANRLSGVLVERDGPYWLVETNEGLRLRGVATTEQNSWQAGMPVTLCFKSEETRADSPSSLNQISGRTKLVEYLGQAFEVAVTIGDKAEKQLLVYSSEMPEIGAEITFGIRPERLLIFADQEEPESGKPIIEAGSSRLAEKKGEVSDDNLGRVQTRQKSQSAPVSAE
jgi:putative spermidine/putrescine transport system ATP-binding protein